MDKMNPTDFEDDDDQDDDQFEPDEALEMTELNSKSGQDEELNEDDVIFPRTTLSARDLLHRLITDANTVTGKDLFAFSDLSRQDAETVHQEWPHILVERRRTILREMVQSAIEDLDWQLGRILRIALEDSDAQVRQIALEGLWEDGSSDLIGPLIQLMRNDESIAVRAAAASALSPYVLAGELDELDAALGMRVEEALLAILQSNHEPTLVKSRALESIAYSGETGVRQLIEDAYYSPAEELRVSSLVAMGRSADVHWRGYARAELLNPSAAMRAEAARACGELEAKAALKDLLELLVDEAQIVRLAAIFALGCIGGHQARDALRALSAIGEEDEEGEETPEAAAATEALEEMNFYADANGLSLLDEEGDDTADDTEDDWDEEPWNNADEDNLGEYEA